MVRTFLMPSATSFKPSRMSFSMSRDYRVRDQLKTLNSELRTSERGLCLLPSAFCLLPSAFCLLPSAFCLLPSALPYTLPSPRKRAYDKSVLRPTRAGLGLALAVPRLVGRAVRAGRPIASDLRPEPAVLAGPHDHPAAALSRVHRSRRPPTLRDAHHDDRYRRARHPARRRVRSADSSV